MKITYHSIGVIHTPYDDLAGMPIQPAGAPLVQGTIEVFPEFVSGLKDLDGFSHIILIYHLHQVKKSDLLVTPFLDDQPRGIYATRAPSRPNPIGLSIVKLSRIEGDTLHIENVDVLDGTPLLDIKPYVPEFDHYVDVNIGWLEKARGKVQGKKSDQRFS